MCVNTLKVTSEAVRLIVVSETIDGSVLLWCNADVVAQRFLMCSAVPLRYVYPWKPVSVAKDGITATLDRMFTVYDRSCTAFFLASPKH